MSNESLFKLKIVHDYKGHCIADFNFMGIYNYHIFYNSNEIKEYDIIKVANSLLYENSFKILLYRFIPNVILKIFFDYANIRKYLVRKIPFGILRYKI